MADRVAIVAIVVFVFLGIIGVAQMLNPPANSVPPTNAFSEIVINGVSYKADSYNSKLYLIGDGISMNGSVINFEQPPGFSKVMINGALLQATSPESQINIQTSGSENGTLSGNTIILKLKQVTCPTLQAMKKTDSNGNILCAVL